MSIRANGKMDFRKLCVLSKELDATNIKIDRVEKMVDDNYAAFLPMEQYLAELEEKAEKIKLEMTSMIAAFCDSEEERERNGNEA